MIFAELEIGDLFVLPNSSMKPGTKVTKTSFLCGNCPHTHRIDPFIDVIKITSGYIKQIGSICINMDRRGVPIGL